MTRLMNKIILINNRRTSMRMCRCEWEALYEICKIERISKNHLIEMIESGKSKELGLTYSTRLFLVNYFREAASEDGHKQAGHGQLDSHDSIKSVLKKISEQ